MNDWKPIETVPKDGTDVLLYYPCYPNNKRKVWIGSYNVYESFLNGKLDHKHEGWSVQTPMLSMLQECAPTHWMSLPAAPIAGTEARRPSPLPPVT